jgi:hypothetical protein
MSRPSQKVEAAAQAIFAIDSRPLGRPGTPWRQLLPSGRAAYRAMATAALAAAARVEEESSKGDDAGPHHTPVMASRRLPSHLRPMKTAAASRVLPAMAMETMPCRLRLHSNAREMPSGFEF